MLVFNENKRRRDMHIDPKLEKYREQIRQADKIVFVYPIWWGRPPAMLLGYIDQMFASNFAYREKGWPHPRRAAERKVCGLHFQHEGADPLSFILAE